MSQSAPALAPTLAIGKHVIHAHDGLYSLNDLHRASGGEERNRPVEYMRLAQTLALLAELEKGGDSHLFLKTVKGRNGGTYACRELVIAYAAWISAAFHLKVIRVFLAVAAPAKPYSVTPGQTLSGPQADTLRNLLTSGVKRLPAAQQGRAMVQGWSKLKAHFGVDYRHIPASEFHEAVSIIARHLAGCDADAALEGPIKVVPALDPSRTLEPAPAPAVSVERIRQAQALAVDMGAAFSRAVFDAVIDGSASPATRWMCGMAYDVPSRTYSRPYAKAIEHEAYVLTVDEMAKVIASPDFMVSNAQLMALHQATGARIAHRLGCPAGA